MSASATATGAASPPERGMSVEVVGAPAQPLARCAWLRGRRREVGRPLVRLDMAALVTAGRFFPTSNMATGRAAESQTAGMSAAGAGGAARAAGPLLHDRTPDRTVIDKEEVA